MVSGWFGWVAERPTRAELPSAEKVDLRYLLSDMWNVVTPCLRPVGQANRKASCGRYGVRWWKKPRPSCNGMDTGWEPRLYITRSVRELTSIGCFVARKLVEPILGGKASEVTLCVPCALHRMGFGCQCVSQRWSEFLVTGSPLCRGRPLKGLSRVTVTCHARFLGGLGSAMTPGYPVWSDIWFLWKIRIKDR